MLTSFRRPRRRLILGPSQEGRSAVDVTQGVWGAHNHSAGPMDRDFGASWELLGALLASSLVHVVFEVVFFSSSRVLGTILVSTTDLPTFKNKVFS